MNEELVGYRGEQIVDAGYFYAPYIPLTTTPVAALDPEIWTPRQGLLTRYGQQLFEEGGQYYSRIRFGYRFDATEVDWKREGF